jgi:hypothetical protein
LTLKFIKNLPKKGIYDKNRFLLVLHGFISTIINMFAILKALALPFFQNLANF